MKKFILTIIATILSIFGVSAQNFVQEGNTFVQQKKEKTVKKSTEYTETTFTWKDVKGNTYPIYINMKNGVCVVKRISSKTGKEYNQYMDSDICEKISKEYNVTYTPKKRKEAKKEDNQNS